MTVPSALVEMRCRLEVVFAADTASPGSSDVVPSAGHCAAVAVIVFAEFGGSLLSTTVQGVSHWFNRVELDGSQVDTDLTGDQFGFPCVQCAPPQELYVTPRLREVAHLNVETLKRAGLLATRAGYWKAVEWVGGELRRRLDVRPVPLGTNV